jgi:putative transcription factor
LEEKELLLGVSMPDCTLCGKRVPDLNKIELEGTVIETCDDCSKYGTIVEVRADSKMPRFETKPRPEYIDPGEDVEFVLVTDYGKRVKQAREKMGLDREKFALKLQERESIIRRLERQEMEPDDTLIKKLERELKITLREELE